MVCPYLSVTKSQLPRSKEPQLCLQSRNTKSCENYEQIRNLVVNIKNKQDRVVLDSVKAARLCSVHRLHSVRRMKSKIIGTWFNSNQLPNAVLQITT